MNQRTVLTLANRRNIDLLNPTPADYTPLAWAAEHLAKEARYNGATPGVVYSVAQHKVEGVFAILEETGDKELAAYFSLHDVPEAVLKDDTTPKKRALAALAEERFGVLASSIMATFGELTERHDRAVHAAAGLAWPLPPKIAERVAHYDRTMLVTEWRDFMPGVTLPNAEAYADVTPLKRTLIPRANWMRAADELVDAWLDLLPSRAVLLG